MEYIPCYSAPAVHWGLLPVTRLASRKILNEQNIKGGQGQHSGYLASWSLPANRLASRKILIEKCQKADSLYLASFVRPVYVHTYSTYITSLLPVKIFHYPSERNYFQKDLYDTKTFARTARVHVQNWLIFLEGCKEGLYVLTWCQ
jgi:hypothetical protein